MVGLSFWRQQSFLVCLIADRWSWRMFMCLVCWLCLLCTMALIGRYVASCILGDIVTLSIEK
jgi:hypothetical protein